MPFLYWVAFLFSFFFFLSNNMLCDLSLALLQYIAKYFREL